MSAPLWPIPRSPNSHITQEQAGTKKVELGIYPFRVGTVIWVSCMRLLRLMKSEDWEVRSSLVEDWASAVESGLWHDNRSSFISSWWKNWEKSFWTDASSIPNGLFSACVIIWNNNERKQSLKRKNEPRMTLKVKIGLDLTWIKAYSRDQPLEGRAQGPQNAAALLSLDLT